MDQKEHGEFTHSESIIDPVEGGEYSAYNGDLHGTFIKLVPDELISLRWRCEMEGWPEDHFSIVTMELYQSAEGTEVDFVQTDIPDECYEAIQAGWAEFYWEPIEEHIGR